MGANVEGEHGNEHHRQFRAIQRWSGMVGGGALAVYGLTRRSRSGLALAAAGGLVAYASSKIPCEGMEAEARNSVVVNVPAEQAFQFWRRLENLPSFMRHLQSVTDLGNGRSRWIAFGPGGTEVTWDAEILQERENEMISWRSLPGSEVEVEGSVEFHQAAANRGTQIDSKVHYKATKQWLKALLPTILGRYPHFAVEQDLRRFKALLETGETPTTEGQPHGRRSQLVGLSRVIDPNQPRKPGSYERALEGARRRA